MRTAGDIPRKFVLRSYFISQSLSSSLSTFSRNKNNGTKYRKRLNKNAYQKLIFFLLFKVIINYVLNVLKSDKYFERRLYASVSLRSRYLSYTRTGGKIFQARAGFTEMRAIPSAR